MSTLSRILDHIGFQARPQQTALYEHLLGADENGVVAQAGTGTGKSLAVFAAAYDWYEMTGQPSLVVCPTNVLMDQYMTVDAPRVSAALGVRVAALKGRNRYLCESANGFSPIANPPAWVMDDVAEMKRCLNDFTLGPQEPINTQWFGCPGGEECDPELECHYRWAKEIAQQAQIIVTNSHLLIIDNQFQRMRQVTGEDGGPRIFPDLGVVFVDEAHVLEESLREFATRSIPQSAVDGYLLGYWLHDQCAKLTEPTAITGDADLAAALQELASIERVPGVRLGKRLADAQAAALYILARAQAKAYSSGAAVLYLDPAERWSNKQHRLVSTQIDMSMAARGLLTSQPFGLVSATIPKSLRTALGIPEAVFVDVGHPFDYSKQAKLGISRYSGAWKVVKADDANMVQRAEEIREQVEAIGGGALLLFPSYRDLEFVHRRIAGPLHLAGLKILKQERDSNKALLAAQFRADGNAVLFGTESFATGFDVPGDALRLVSIWKLPYPGLDPLTRAISNRDYSRYEDMMLTKVAQAAGRLIRTSDDVGEIWVADSRATGKILGTGDPMLAHFDQFQFVAPPQPVDMVEMN